MEVLFAVMVATIGLLGALAVFPVASTQARRGRTQDSIAVAGTSAVHVFDTRQMRDPRRWMAYDASINGNPSNTGNQKLIFSEYQQFLSGSGGHNWFGGFDSFCIDPRFVAANFKTPATPANGVVPAAATFPAGGNGIAMWRISLSDGLSMAMRKALADTLFVCEDDLTYDRPDDNSRQARQMFDDFPSAPGSPSKRQTDGHLSWMATLVPKLDRLNFGPSDLFVLSIVVFHDRPAGLSATDPLNERVANVNAMPGLGVTGGEVQLSIATTSLPAGVTVEDYLKVKAGDWVLLKGVANPTSVFKWYRVLDTDSEIEDLGGGSYGRYVTLMGQDWDMTTTQTTAVLVEGVAGVYEKTIRLETN